MYWKLGVGVLVVLAATVAGWGYYQVHNYDGMRATYTIELAAPPAAVWEQLVDPEKRPVWVKGLIRIVPLSGQAGTTGSRSLLLMLSAGRRFDVEEQIIGIEPNIWLGLESNTLDALLTTTFTLEPVGPARTSTRLTFVQDTFHNTWYGKMFAPFLRISAENAARNDLAKLKTITEKSRST